MLVSPGPQRDRAAAVTRKHFSGEGLILFLGHTKEEEEERSSRNPKVKERGKVARRGEKEGDISRTATDDDDVLMQLLHSLSHSISPFER